MINKNIKPILCAVLCMALLLAFAGCNKTDADPTETTEPQVQIVDLSITLQENTMCRQYGTVNATENKSIDGQTHLLEKAVFDLVAEMDISNAYALIPEDYHAKIAEILDKYDFVAKYNQSALDHDKGYYGMAPVPATEEADSEENSLVLVIEYSDGTKILVETKKQSQIDAMEGMLTDLVGYHDSICGNG